MKKFKAKKIRKKRLRKVFLIFFIFSYIYFFNFLSKSNKKINKKIIYENINYYNFNVLDTINKTIDVFFKDPKVFLDFNTKSIIRKSYNNNVSTDNININKIFTPSIYIYNTHQSEEYNNYSVYDASNELKDALNKKGLDSIFEENSIKVFLSNNNMKYYESYKVSRKYINDAMNKYNSLSYFFDIHRDSLSRDKTTLEYNKKRYAKILFIIGLDNKNYEDNLKNVKILNDIIEKKIPGISKGIYKKSGKNVNGLYNQDISSNLFLIEIGGIDNTKDEVLNTINVLSDSISFYVNGAI